MSTFKETATMRLLAETQAKSLIEANEALGMELRPPTLALSAALASIMLVIRQSGPVGLEQKLEGLLVAMKGMAELEYDRHLSELAEMARQNQRVTSRPPASSDAVN
jgi:hypothetical protein